MIMDQKRRLIDPRDLKLSVKKQCALVSLSRSSYYYEAVLETPRNLELMRLIDEIYMERSYYGTRKIKVELQKQGQDVGRDLIRALMQKMGIEAVYQKPKTSLGNAENKVYPYLLRNVPIMHCNHVWSSDITYLPMKNGFLYLMAIIDWFSRYVVTWKLSNSLDGFFCLEGLKEALGKGVKPSIFNTDQGVQFTANSFTDVLKGLNIAISMDGRGRCLDNVFCERLWRSVKYEEVYLKDYSDGGEAHEGLSEYFQFYNEKRPHQSLGYITPRECYLTGRTNAKRK